MIWRTLKFFIVIAFLLAPVIVVQAGPADVNLESNTGVVRPSTAPDIKDFSENQGLLSNIGTTSKCLSDGECSLCDILQVAVNIGNFMLAIAGALALIMFIWGAWGLIVARGDDEKITGAKGTLWAALAGMVFVLISWELVAVVLVILTGNGNPFKGVCGL